MGSTHDCRGLRRTLSYLAVVNARRAASLGIVGVITLTASLTSTVALAASDSTPPTLASFSFTPTTVDTSASQQAITFTARITDDLAGVSSGYIEFDSPSGQYLSAQFYSNYRVSGTAQDGNYVYNAIVPRYSEQGTWTAVYGSLTDGVGNRRSAKAAILSRRGSSLICARTLELDARIADNFKVGQRLSPLLGVGTLVQPSDQGGAVGIRSGENVQQLAGSCFACGRDNSCADVL